MTQTTLAIIGSGPAGLMAALIASKAGINTTIYEKNKTIGGKIAIAGGGKCNFTHNCTYAEFLQKYGDNGQFLKFAFKALNLEKTRQLFNDLGIPSYQAENGKFFPKSNSGKDIIRKFKNALLKNKVQIQTNTLITKLKYKDKWYLNEENEGYDYLIIATGGFYHDSKNINANFWQSLGLKQVALKPALTAISSSDNHQDLAGITIKDVKVSVYNENKSKTIMDDILITHKAYSGPAIHNISRYLASQSKLYINWLNLENQVVDNAIKKQMETKGKQQLKTALLAFNLPKALIDFLLLSEGINADIKLAELNKKTRQTIVKLLTNYQVKNPQTLGFNTAMVASGGLDLSEINAKTMQVKKQKNLYVVGEALDIDGDSGGFNIQAALSMGYLAAQTIVVNK